MCADKFIKQVKAINSLALEETKKLLQSSEGKYIYFPDFDDEFGTDSDGVSLTVMGVGLNEKGNICILAEVNNIGYGCSGDEYPNDWADITEDTINPACYPHLYRFVAENIDSAMSKEEANALRQDEEDYE